MASSMIGTCILHLVFNEFLSSISDHDVEEAGAACFAFRLDCDMCNLCHVLFALPLGVISSYAL